MPTKSYGTKDLEGARFEAQVLQRLSELKDDVSTAVKILERQDTQIRELQTNDALRKRELESAHHRLDGIENRMRDVLAYNPTDTKRAIDDLSMRFTGYVSTMPQDIKSRIEALESTSNSHKPVIRVILWAAGPIGLLLISLAWKTFIGG